MGRSKQRPLYGYLQESWINGVIAIGCSFCMHVKHGENSIFMKKGKTIISVGNQKFSRSWMTKRTSPLNSSQEI